MSAALDWVSTFLYAAILAGVPLLFGTLGEILTEKAGNVNLGVEGMMYMGAVFGFMGGYYLDSVPLVLLLAFLGGMAGAAVYAFLTVTLKANQNVTGLTLTIVYRRGHLLRRGQAGLPPHEPGLSYTNPLPGQGAVQP